MKEHQFNQAYTINEVSRHLSVPSGVIRQWEKDFKDTLTIRRSKQGARIFQEQDILLLLKIKQLRDKNLRKETIRELLQEHSRQGTTKNTVQFIEICDSPNEIKPFPIQDVSKTIEEYKNTIIAELKEEMKNGLRKEIIDEVKKEISKNTLITVKSLSDSIYKSSEKTIDTITKSLSNASEITWETIDSLSDTIANASDHTLQSIDTYSRHVEKISSSSANRVSRLEKNISNASKELVEHINSERQYFIEALYSIQDQFTNEINKREKTFQELVMTFRHAAAVKENNKKWWEFWKIDS